MIQVYSPGNEQFDKNGDTVIYPSEASVLCELNGTWSASLTHPLDAEGRWKYIVENSTIKMPSYNGPQLFRVNYVNKTDVISCEMTPVFFNAADDCFLTDKRPTNKTGQQALDILTEGSRYSGISNITKISSAYYEYKNLLEALTADDNSFLQRWGGEIEFDNFTVRIMDRIGSDNGLELRYGKNIEGMTYTVDMSQVRTRLFPKAYNGYKMTGIPYVDSPLLSNYPNVKAGTITFDHIRMAVDVTEEQIDDPELVICQNQDMLNSALRQACLDEFDAGLDKPTVTVQIDDLVDLSKVVGYEELARPIHLGDTVYLRHSLFDVISTARINSLTYDSVRDCVRSITVGDVAFNFMDALSSTVSKVSGTIRDDGSLRAETIRGVVDMKKAALYAQYDELERQDVLGILFENNDRDSVYYGAMALGTQGFMIADTKNADGSWNWQTFGTARGFDASMLITGILSSRDGSSFWDLDDSEFRFYDAENDTSIAIDLGMIRFYHGQDLVGTISRRMSGQEEVITVENEEGNNGLAVGENKIWLNATSNSWFHAEADYSQTKCGDAYVRAEDGANGKGVRINGGSDTYLLVDETNKRIYLNTDKFMINGYTGYSGTVTISGKTFVIQKGVIVSVT